jgi:hypothetical protein
MNEIKEGSIDLADKSIDLEDIDNAYEEDLDKENLSDQDQQQAGAPEGMGAPMGAPMAGPGPAPLPPV